MAKTIIRAQMKQRIDTIENWEAKNPVLLNGELGLISNDQRYKVGDGSTPWNDLPYRGASADITIAQETGASEKAVMSQKAVTEELKRKISIGEYEGKTLAEANGLINDDDVHYYLPFVNPEDRLHTFATLAAVDDAIATAITNTLNTEV